MSNALKIAAGVGAPSDPLYVDDVFSAYTYTGNGTSQTISNGIDLAGKGGMVWIKARSDGSAVHAIYDTQRGTSAVLSSNTSGGNSAISLNSFNNNGFTLGTSFNGSAITFASWTFRKAPKFFDVVTWTGNGTLGRAISHNLGTEPGMILIKKTNSTSDWVVYHRDASKTYRLILNTTDGRVATSNFNNTLPTSTTFTVSAESDVNATGNTYVAYLFAHDTAADGIIQCGSVSHGASGGSVNLGWEPQYVLIKQSDSTGNWVIYDSMRGVSTGGSDYPLHPNLSAAESEANDGLDFTSQGFATKTTYWGTSARTFIYLVIRRSNKPPTSGAQVFQPTVYTGTNTNNRFLTTNLTTDLVMLRQRNGAGAGFEGMVVGSRLTGQKWLKTGLAQSELATTNGLDQQLVSATEYGNAFSAMDGIWIGADGGAVSDAANINVSTTANQHIAYAFKRAKGFMNVVCYMGTGANRTVEHNLGVAPELIIVKSRGTSGFWTVFYGPTNAAVFLNLYGAANTAVNFWQNTQPTANAFSVNNEGEVNATGLTYIAILFATLPGISKVGTYTGNGSSQTINCGFSTGARFILIKRTDSTGDWYVWDSARGIVAGNDPHLSLNTSVAEVTTNDSVDPDNSGFTVNQLTATNINVTSATYIYLAIA